MDTHAAPDAAGFERRGIEMEELSRAMVRLYRERFGRGPTKAQSVYATADLLICTLENSLTPAERTMADMGEHQRPRDIRMFFQHASEKELVEVVEQITGRMVRGFVSGVDTEHDISSEVFYLQPAASSSPGP
jgi:uncharacterized protein YbcI